jgi:hypothetical protein
LVYLAYSHRSKAMTKLDEMWAALEKHQEEADDEGHGDTWSEMCRLKTSDAAYHAADAAALAAAVVWDAYNSNHAAYAAARAADAAAYAYAVESWAPKAIEAINKAIFTKKHSNDN